MKRLRDDLSAEEAERVELRMYDETVRFNLMFINHQLGVMQTYLPAVRGLSSPTFVLRHTGPDGSDLYSVYSRVFTSLWERGKPL